MPILSVRLDDWLEEVLLDDVLDVPLRVSVLQRNNAAEESKRGCKGERSDFVCGSNGVLSLRNACRERNSTRTLLSRRFVVMRLRAWCA